MSQYEILFLCSYNFFFLFSLPPHQIGLVNHSVPQTPAGDAAYQKALEVARQILPNGPVGVRMAKVICYS